MRLAALLLAIPLLLVSCGGAADVTGGTSVSSESSSSLSSAAPVNPYLGWKEYLTDAYWLTLKYPPEYTFAESGRQGKVPVTDTLPTGVHPVAYETITFSAPGKPSFALSVFRGVDGQTSVADLTYDPRCGLQAVDTIELSKVYVTQEIRFVEKRQMLNGKVDIDFCFLNRQRHVLSLHAWGLEPADADIIQETIKQVQKTIVLYRGRPSDRKLTRPAIINHK